MKMSTMSKTKRCFVCSDEFNCSNLTAKENFPPTSDSEDEENNFNESDDDKDNILTLIENTKLCKKFCILAARYLDFGFDFNLNKKNLNSKHLNLNTAETLKLYLDNESDDGGCDSDTICCDNCVKLVDTFCANYEALKYLQMELDWNLRQITQIMGIGKENRFHNEIVNQEDNDSLNSGLILNNTCNQDSDHHDHDDSIQLTETFKMTLLTKYETARRKKYPRLTLSMVSKKSGTRKPMSNVMSPVRDANNLDLDITIVDPGAGQEPKVAEHRPSPPLKAPTFKMPPRKRHSCATCGKAFSMVSQLRSHEEIHLPEDARPLKCEICGKGFLYMEDLQRHVTSHSIKRPYKCSFCESRFLQESNLRIHEEWHVRGGNKKATHLCRYCGQAFTKSSNKVRHERIHSGERPYSCPCCEFTFNDRSAWKKHIQRRHGATTASLTQTHGFRGESADVPILPVVYEAENENLDYNNVTFHSDTGTGLGNVNSVSSSSSSSTSPENFNGTAARDAAVYYQEYPAISIKTSVDEFDIEEIHEIDEMEIDNLDAEYPLP